MAASRKRGGSRHGRRRAGMLTAGDSEATSRPVQTRMSQSAIAREQAEAIELPPRRDFEVVVLPARRKALSFQVERRTLPRRV